MQGAYKFLPSKWEAVLSYGEFDALADYQEQWAMGINYLFAGNIIAKLGYESNKNLPERWLAQLAYGH